MKCPFCGKDDTRVIDSRPADENTSIRRRRVCDSCGKRFTTYEKVETIPLSDMFLPVHTPDIVITQNAYDQYGIGFTVSPEYYSEKILQYAGEVVYTPWFVIDDVLPEHQGAWSVAYSYIDMPGVVKADKILVSSYSMRYSYIEHLTEFAGQDTWKHWEESVQVAGTEEDCERIFHLRNTP